MSRPPRVVMISLWRNDAGKRLAERLDHLMAKTYPNLRYVWIVGDSDDDTERLLRAWANMDSRITVVRHDTGIQSHDPATRVVQLSRTGGAGLDQVNRGDTWVLPHESDLVSPPDLVERMLARKVDVLAGWVTLHRSDDEEPLFYDTWAFRGLDGAMFSNYPPYHPSYRPDALFEVESVGSVVLFRARHVLDGVRALRYGWLEICAKLRARGERVWVDPTLPIVQPRDLWTSHSHAPLDRSLVLETA